MQGILYVFPEIKSYGGGVGITVKITGLCIESMKKGKNAWEIENYRRKEWKCWFMQALIP